MNAYWRAANYLSVGQIYLPDNPLLTEPLQPKHIKPRLLGHWGTTPGLNLLYAHLNRIIQEARPQHDLRHRAQATAAPGWWPTLISKAPTARSTPISRETTTECESCSSQFSFPGGIPSHVAAETPGSIHEGGELGYAWSHAYGAAFDNPDLIVAAVVGDGEAETGALATSWHSNKFLNPATTARCCRSSISTDTRSPAPPSRLGWPMQNWKRVPRLRLPPDSSSRATIPSPCR